MRIPFDTPDPERLIQGRRIARNTLLNLFGYFAPLIVAVFCIPFLIEGLGKERFGVLTLAWVFVSYLGLFDLGIGRALTKLAAEKIGAGKADEIPGMLWTGVVIMTGLGIIVSLAVWLALPSLVDRWLNIPEALNHETYMAFALLAFGVPVIVVSIGLRGVLDAYQRFDLANWVRVPMGIYMFAAPLAVIPFSKNLLYIAAILMIGRVAVLYAHFRMCIAIVPDLLHGPRFQRRHVKPLLRFGGWMTVTNLITPLMVYADRFFIGALATLTMVAYYATPHEIIIKFQLVPIAMMGVFFPAFSTSFMTDRARTGLLLEQGIRFLFLVLFPACLFVVALAPEILYLWLGADFAANSREVMQLLAVGVFLLSVAYAPYSMIQGIGRPEITAIMHLAELPLYVPMVWGLTVYMGIKGTALAWCIRIAVDTAAMFLCGAWLLPERAKAIAGLAAWVVIPSTVVLCAPVFMHPLPFRIIWLVLFLLIYGHTGWKWLLQADEKAYLKKIFTR